MFENFNPSKRVMDESTLDRREALFDLGALLGGSSLIGGAAMAPTTAQAKSLNLDFSRPEDNLTAWVKLASSLEDRVETCGFFSGTQSSGGRRSSNLCSESRASA